MIESDRPDIVFGCIADLQYNDADPYKNRFFRNSIKKLNVAIDHFNLISPDFVINLGDTIDRNWNSFDAVIPNFERLDAHLYQVIGNHDYEVEDSKKELVHQKLGIERYYSFQVQDWVFVVLDGNEISTFANIAGSENFLQAETILAELNKEEVVYGNFWNGGISSQQLRWLSNMLDRIKDQEKVIIFCHYPVYPLDKHNLLNCNHVLEIVNSRHCVKAWINGHNHDGNYARINDTHFINVKGMVEDSEEVTFSIFKLYPERLEIQGFGKEISAVLQF